MDHGVSGINLAYLLDQFDRYQADPAAVTPELQDLFKKWRPPTDHLIQTAPSTSAEIPPKTQASPDLVQKAIAAANLAETIRVYGHLAAHLDPLGSAPPGDPALELKNHGLTEDDLTLLPASVVGGPIAENASNAAEAVRALRGVYTSAIGFEFDHIHQPAERAWLRHTAECGFLRPPQAPLDELALLERLTRIEVFELFLDRFFPGKTRFSIEGLDMLIPMLDEIINKAADEDICMVMLGMAHRGRLNVLAHVLCKPYAQILAEFKDPGKNMTTLDELGWRGDVKYHKGASHPVRGGEEIKLVIAMAPNPSHLEHVNPVVTGMARAGASGVKEPGPPVYYPKATLPILIHGDAAFPGEGIVAETLNLSRLPGYQVGGTIHLIANNQLGFTTNPRQGRSTLYASDLAKGFEIPILHVNADQPIACVEAARIAAAYRLLFQKDILIDLIGYRRHGHNEGDEPGFTQPALYATVKSHPTVRQIWADRLSAAGMIQPQQAEELVTNQMKELQQALDTLDPDREVFTPRPLNGQSHSLAEIETRVSLEWMGKANAALHTFPDSFHLHRKLERGIQRRRSALENPEEPAIEWAHAEGLAFAAILSDGIPIRLTGQDVERGTFSQRHAVYHDAQDGSRYIPLHHLPGARASFEICNSALSENAALGFEYGYNVAFPPRLVVWEAQYGDFINSAQAIVDEFVVSGWAKWDQKPSLVLLLPHGYEGQGPDHSSARLERFLQLSNEANLRVANCTTAAQYFHLLRRQAALLTAHPLPLVVFTPKSLLRHPRVLSRALDLAEGAWQPVLPDPDQPDPQSVDRLLLCSGKIGVDLLEHPGREQRKDLPVLRLEQLSPFPYEELHEAVGRYPNLSSLTWVQEEPENMGAWDFVRPRLRRLFGENLPVRYVGRPASASPSEGSYTWHSAVQKGILEEALRAEPESVNRMVAKKEGG